MVPVFVEVLALIKNEVLDQRFTEDTAATLAGAADCFVSLFAGRVHHIKGDITHIGNHDSAVCRLALDFRRAGVGMRLWAGFTFRHQSGLQLRNDIAVFGVH